MKHFTAILVCLPLAACGFMRPNPSSPSAPPPGSIDSRVQALESRMESRDDIVGVTVRELTNQVNDLNRRLTQAEQGAATQRADMDDLRRRLAMVMTPGAQPAVQPTSETTPAPTPAAAPAAAPAAPTRDITQRVGEIVILLRDPDFHGTDALATELRGQAGQATELLLREVRNNPRDYRLAENVENLIAAWPPETVRDSILRGLEDRALRLTAARVAARLGDSELLPTLKEQLAAAQGEDEQVGLALAVVGCHDDAGAPILVRALRSERIDIRILSHTALRRAYRTDGFGYNPLRTPAENESPIRQWEHWWDGRRAAAGVRP